MDELTRERFWPSKRATAVDERHMQRRLTLLSASDDEATTIEKRRAQLEAQAVQEARLRAEALLRSRRLARAIRVYEVRTGG